MRAMDPTSTTTEPRDPAVGPDPPHPVIRAWQHHRWTSLSFLHWRYDPAVVQAMLPAGLEVDTYDGAAWVGLIPFRLDIRAPGMPYLPWAGRFVETNVRTYVRTADGARGIWFFSLDAQRLGAVVAARTAWSLPYQWSHMRLTRVGARVTYECRRRWPGGFHPTSHVVLDVGDEYRPDDIDGLDHFLTARWVLFSTRGSSIVRTSAHHRAWPLRRAAVVECDDQLLRAAGLPSPTGEPRALYSDGVEVRLGARHTH
jgi:uncharacterized protein YqjF (DUF2071 family)